MTSLTEFFPNTPLYLIFYFYADFNNLKLRPGPYFNEIVAFPDFVFDIFAVKFVFLVKA